MTIRISIVHMFRVQLHTIGMHIRMHVQSRALQNEQRSDR